jgi:DNA-binding response OmpR family regulator
MEKKKILVVDDDIHILRMLKRALETERFNVFTASPLPRSTEISSH